MVYGDGSSDAGLVATDQDMAMWDSLLAVRQLHRRTMATVQGVERDGTRM